MTLLPVWHHPLMILILALACDPVALDVPDTDEADADTDTDTDTDTDADTDVPTPGDVALNEMLSYDSSGGPDWIELYNPGEEDMDLSGWGITDHYGQYEPYEFENGTEIPGGEYLLLLADGENRVDDDIHLSFRLAFAGETITLLDDDGDVYDETAFPEMEGDHSWAAIPDGSDDWEEERNPTPGRSND